MNHYSLFGYLFIAIVSANLFAADKKSATLQKDLQGRWKLTALTCNGVKQPVEKMDYTLTFEGTKGAFISKTKTCTQIEPEDYNYLTADTISIKQGIRKCTPNPCEADLAASECGKETNPKLPTFHVDLKDSKTMVLSTSDEKSIDCTAPGQKKPAVFTFNKL